jgi:two-component system response regulator QseB
MRHPTLLLIEDDPKLGPLIEQVLAESYTVTRIPDGTAGLETASTGEFDVMVIDRRLPGIDGRSIVSTIRSRRISTPVLMLTALGTVGDRVEGLDAGANDYLVKPFEFDELLARLRALLRTFADVDDAIAIGEWEFHPSSRSIHSPYSGSIQLTARESDLLQLLAEQPLHVFSRTHILHSVFGSGEQPGSVDTYVHYLRRKTDSHIITTVRGQGYRIGEP